MADSTIEWTTKTWNSTTGCNKIVCLQTKVDFS